MTEFDDMTAGQIPLFRPKQLPRTKQLSAAGLKAQHMIKKHAVIAGGIGFMPLTRFSDQMVMGGLLVKLLGDLCRIYGVSFSDQQRKILVAAILGGAHSGWISRYLMKFIKGYTPVLQAPVALLLRPAVSGMLVYAIGRLFLVHLESGVWHAEPKD